ncbi:MAG: hypothetical protein KF716_02780 [Anaerolineae bacterium]|nr:hypothetical protein [Anaerolineae bacterium]
MPMTIKIITLGSIFVVLVLFSLFTLAPLVSSRPVASACSNSQALKYQRLTDLPTNGGTGNAMTFSADGRLIATTGTAFGAQVWDTTTFMPLTVWQDNDQALVTVSSLAFSPDGHYLAVGSDDHTTPLYEVTTGKLLRRIKHSYDVRRVQFSADSRWLASASWDGSIEIVDLTVAGMATKWRWHPEVTDGTKLLVTDIAISPDSRWVASLSQGSWGPSLLDVWDIQTGSRKTLVQWNLAVYSNVIFSPDSRWLIAGTGSGAPITVWEVGMWREIAQLPTRGPFNRIAISPNGKSITYSENLDGQNKHNIRVWRTDSWSPLTEFTLDDVVWDVQFSPDSTQIAVAVGQPQLQADGRNLGLHEAQVRDAQTGEVVVRIPQPDSDEVLSVQFSPDGCQLALGTQNGVTVWQVR